MKNLFKTLVLITALSALSSCSPIYQVLETSSNNAKLEKDDYVYENSELRISYNFWTNGGQMSFTITNKTDEPIYIDWNKSHFIHSGVSYEYWYDAEITKSVYKSSTRSISETIPVSTVNAGTKNGMHRSYTTSFGGKTTTETSNTYKPKRVIQIPPKSSVLISNFTLRESPYYTCEFPFKYSQSKTPATTTFTKENSPLTFRNYITYSSKETFEQEKTIDNDFYISSVSNMNLTVFKGKSDKKKYCKQSGYRTTKIVYPYPFKKSNAFYIKVQQ